MTRYFSPERVSALFSRENTPLTSTARRARAHERARREGTTYHDLAQLSISRLTRSELVLGPHPREMCTPQGCLLRNGKNANASAINSSATRRRKFRYRKVSCIARATPPRLTIYAANVIVYALMRIRLSHLQARRERRKVVYHCQFINRGAARFPEPQLY